MKPILSREETVREDKKDKDKKDKDEKEKGGSKSKVNDLKQSPSSAKLPSPLVSRKSAFIKVLPSFSAPQIRNKY